MKKILVLFDIKGGTSQQYDKAWDELRAAGQENPEGLIHHTGAQKGDGFVVVDVWESQAAFEKFGQTLMPILQRIGMPDVQPQILDVRYDLVPKMATAM